MSGRSLFAAKAQCFPLEPISPTLIKCARRVLRRLEYDDHIEATCRLIENLPQPTIALIEGICFGAGASLAASCDLRVASEEACFAVPAARLGLGYDIHGMMRFNRVFGPQATIQLLLTADRLSAPRAYALGAVHILTPRDAVESAAFSLAQRIAANAPLTLSAAKAALQALTQNDPVLKAQALALAALANASMDYAEGRNAFLEKRAPQFTGQ